MEEKEIIQNVQKYFDNDISYFKRLEHKGNNKLFEIALNNGQKFLLKLYSTIHMDNWERGKAEFKAISYLWKKGFREIPQAINFFNDESMGIYSYEEGAILKPDEIREKDVEQAVNFLIRIHELTGEDKENFSPASSACLCLQDYLDVIDKRLSRIIDFEGKENIEKKAKDFLNNKLIPKINQVKEEFLKKVKEKGIDLKKQINLGEQVLTPADFGFHNILIENGKYKFLDFEYFGRDDPARQILDFLHHASSDAISKKLKGYFVELYCKKRNLDEKFKERLDLLSPLIGITWILIYLNVLSKKQLEHLKFAQGSTENVIRERLGKAEKKLNNVYF